MSFFHWDRADLVLAVHAQPGAKKTEAAGLHGDSLKLRLRARPVEGAANEALLEFLAEALHVPVRRCELISGDKSREKRVRIVAPDRALAEQKLREWSGQAMIS